MKKVLVISAVVVLAILVLGVAGFAYAQTQTPPDPDYPFGRGMMGGWGNRGMGPGMMGRWGANGYGPMHEYHEYMEDAFAEALGITTEELEAKLDAGETMWSIAQAQGLSDEDISKLMVDARTKALEKSVADGVLTQAQADWMIQHMGQAQGSGFGPGACHGSGGPGRGPARQWNNQ